MVWWSEKSGKLWKSKDKNVKMVESYSENMKIFIKCSSKYDLPTDCGIV